MLEQSDQRANEGHISGKFSLSLPLKVAATDLGEQSMDYSKKFA